ncbi:MAG: hypothetical protein KDD82_00700 [Planctomycetes bacterium]|nr:hypothetical protein [Planctomycetota bacterium]
MFSLLIPAGTSLAIMLSLLLIPKDPFYLLGPFLGVIVFFPLFMFIRRKVGDAVSPLFERAQRQAQAGNVPKAIESLEEALRYSNWQIFLRPQINTQIGAMHYAGGHEKQAVEFLQNGYPKTSESHLLLGAILSRQGDREGACAALERGIAFNKKSPILYNVLAWIHNRAGQREAAIEVLSRGLKAMKSDPDTSDNLERLQSNKKMSMTPFGQMWYMLKFEPPPGAAQGQPVRKGFRQPPKAGKQPKKKDKKAKKAKRK